MSYIFSIFWIFPINTENLMFKLNFVNLSQSKIQTAPRLFSEPLLPRPTNNNLNI